MATLVIQGDNQEIDYIEEVNEVSVQISYLEGLEDTCSAKIIFSKSLNTTSSFMNPYKLEKTLFDTAIEFIYQRKNLPLTDLSRMADESLQSTGWY